MRLLLETSHGEIIRKDIPENRCSFKNIKKIIKEYYKKQEIRLIQLDCNILDTKDTALYTRYDAYIVNDKKSEFACKIFHLINETGNYARRLQFK